jgi:DNA-binding NtrC family response regulator
MRPSLLLVDDDQAFTEAAAAIARLNKFEPQTAYSVATARRALTARGFDLVLMDLGLPDGSAFDLVDEVRRNGSAAAIVTGNVSVEAASRAVRLPLQEYLLKPMDHTRYEALLNETRERWFVRRGRNLHTPLPGFVGTSPLMQEVYRQIRRVSCTDATVMLVGESGTGKEVVARALHGESGRMGPFVAVNCGAVAPELLASHLFGHERGSFTGAVRQHRGHFEQAEGGTLLLDEITEMPLHLQAHLLRALETRRVARVGGTGEHPIDVRVVAATNRDPYDAIQSGQLREDLYFRLGEFCIDLPPLRQRGRDVVQIAHAILDQLNSRYAQARRFDESTLGWLTDYSWPGNVRELRNTIHRAYILSEDDDVRLSAPRAGLARRADELGMVSFAVGTPLETVEREMLMRTLAHFHGDKTRAAEALGISTKTIYNHLARQHLAFLPHGV